MRCHFIGFESISDGNISLEDWCWYELETQSAVRLEVKQFFLIISTWGGQVGVVVSCLALHLWDPGSIPTGGTMWIGFSVPA